MRNTAAKTLWETKDRCFESDLSIGKIGEELVKRRLLAYRGVEDVIDISNSKRGIRDDIDFEIVYSDGHTSTVEVKTDIMAHKTGNLAYEEFSHRNPGCFARTKADHIIYFIYETGEAYVLSPSKLRAFIKEIKEDEIKARRYRVRATKMGEGASGYLIPLKNIIDSEIIEAKMIVRKV